MVDGGFGGADQETSASDWGALNRGFGFQVHAYLLPRVMLHPRL
jgi:hypothetical protein